MLAHADWKHTPARCWDRGARRGCTDCMHTCDRPQLGQPWTMVLHHAASGHRLSRVDIRVWSRAHSAEWQAVHIPGRPAVGPSLVVRRLSIAAVCGAVFRRLTCWPAGVQLAVRLDGRCGGGPHRRRWLDVQLGVRLRRARRVVGADAERPALRTAAALAQVAPPRRERARDTAAAAERSRAAASTGAA